MSQGESRRLSGFTLIELLIVVGIIGLLMAILAPSLSQARRQARRAACASHLHYVARALRGYAFLHGKYPAEAPAAQHRDPADWPKLAQAIVPDLLHDPRMMYCPEHARTDPLAPRPYFPSGYLRDGQDIPSWEMGDVDYIYLGQATATYGGTYDPAAESPMTAESPGHLILLGDRDVEVRPGHRVSSCQKPNHPERGGWFVRSAGDMAWYDHDDLSIHYTEATFNFYWPDLSP